MLILTDEPIPANCLLAMHANKARSMLVEIAERLTPASDDAREVVYHDDRVCRALADLRSALATLSEPTPESPRGAPCF